MSGSHPLVGEWQLRAEKLMAWGAVELARLWVIAASELAEHEREHWLEALTLTQAANESGYTPDHLGRLLSEGRLENAGERNSPRIRRGELPKKPPKRSTEPDLVGRARRRRDDDQ